MMMTTMAKKSIARTTSGVRSGIFSVPRLLFSTEPASSSPPPQNELYRRILPIGNPRVSIVPVLDQWAREGRPVEPHNFRMIIKQLRRFKRFTHALQVSEWITSNKYFELSPGYFAVKLDLLSKVHGLQRAKSYFDSLPIESRTLEVYASLLNCYASAKDLTKAEEVMQKIREFKEPRKTYSYNLMLKLYSDMGEHRKVESLVQEMEQKGVPQDKFTCSIRMNSYGLANDFQAMEKLMMKIEADPEGPRTWNLYSVAANSYIRAGLVEKAMVTLKKLEQLAIGEDRKMAYELLVSYYARIGRKDEVYRIWNLFKKIGMVFNLNYLGMISSLQILDDLDGAENIYKEWEAAKKDKFDFKLPNLLVKGYITKGLLEKAESFVNRFVESGKDPSAIMWQHLAIGYWQHGQKEKSVEMFRRAALGNYLRGKPNIRALGSCLEYLRGEGRTEEAKELARLMQKKCAFPIKVL